MLRTIITPLVLLLSLSSSVLASPLPSIAGQAVSKVPFELTAPSSLSQCNPATFSWTPTQGPYSITLTSSDEAIIIPSHAQATWMVDLAVGTEVVLTVTDGAGQTASSKSFVVGQGSDACMGEDE
ncbi:hypothetical protein BCR39DRAFT_236414 [Naematelia encephala]|uniref:Ser-Thr-rich glycosyl-phosphatidyl-inositol-anchored membrane family-domain-containing protein n=1 Tax=Naematelia encephala TaxID=71784 RepID=A0A1Y2BH20_9TREE|nr:hypothetical protein BCR39DRAFT_236414 [Naematelia encephala]